MNYEIVTFEPRTIALTNDRDEQAATARLEAFLANNGIVPAHRYRNEMVMKKNGQKLVLYLKYATVPQGTPKASGIMLNDLGAGLALAFTLDQSEYDAFMDGGLREPLDAFMKANGLAWDMSKMIPLAEPRGTAENVVYDVLFPVKRK